MLQIALCFHHLPVQDHPLWHDGMFGKQATINLHVWKRGRHNGAKDGGRSIYYIYLQHISVDFITGDIILSHDVSFLYLWFVSQYCCISWLARLFQLNIFLVYSSYSLENCWEHSAARVDDMLATKTIKSVCNFCNSTMVESQNNRGDERLSINFVEAILSYAFYVLASRLELLIAP